MKKRLRTGFTTGTCAAAAAKAAAIMLHRRRPVDRIAVNLPAGGTATFEIVDSSIEESVASCCVVNDAGADPDVTDGLKICARIRPSDVLAVKGGDGVGVVTAPGLAVPVGEAAINPTPKEMILKEVAGVLPAGAGAEIAIYVPGGAKVAGRTFNPRLGIVGGISIIGTTGIVRPMSVEAYRESLALLVDVAAASQKEFIVLVPGNVGERAALSLGFDEKSVVHMGNHVGFMLDKCIENGMRSILILGHVGKMIKIAGGAFDTDSRKCPLDLGLLMKLAEAESIDAALLEGLKNCATAEEAASILRSYVAVFDRLAEGVSLRASERIGWAARVAAGITDLKGNLLGMCSKAKDLLGDR